MTSSGLGISHQFEYGLVTGGTTGELTRVVTPFGGDLRWTYTSFAYAGSVSYREVATRQMTPASGASQWSWAVTLEGNPGIGQHAFYVGCG